VASGGRLAQGEERDAGSMAMEGWPKAARALVAFPQAGSHHAVHAGVTGEGSEVASGVEEVGVGEAGCRCGVGGAFFIFRFLI
jgi:hypothetical protein